MAKPYYTDYEYTLADMYKSIRNAGSGSRPDAKLDFTGRLLIGEAKTAPAKDPTKFVIGEKEFFKYHALAHKKGKAFVFAVLFDEDLSISITTEADYNTLVHRYVKLDLKADWCGWKQPTNSAGSFTLKQSTFQACHSETLKAGKQTWFVYLEGWKERLIVMPTMQHVVLLGGAGSL